MSFLFFNETFSCILKNLLPSGKTGRTEIKTFPFAKKIEKISENDFISEWIARNIPKDDLVNYLPYDNFIFIARIDYKEQQLHYANLQAFILDHPDHDKRSFANIYDCNIDIKINNYIFYYRLDFDIDKPGSTFDHPYPHIHTRQNDIPRMQFSMDPDIFLPITFLEFLYLNHYKAEWNFWKGNLDRDNPVPNNIIDTYKSADTNERSKIIQNYKKLTDQMYKEKSSNFTYRKNQIPKLRNDYAEFYYANKL